MFFVKLILIISVPLLIISFANYVIDILLAKGLKFLTFPVLGVAGLISLITLWGGVVALVKQDRFFYDWGHFVLSVVTTS